MKRWIAVIALLAISPVSPPGAAEVSRVRIDTTAGTIVIQLDADRAPLTVRSFLQYVQEGFYEGTLIHRVVNGFVIQGGGYTKDLKPKQPHTMIPNESGNGLSNRRGTIAMARATEPHSADSQFYINLADNVSLDPKPTRWGYAVFGEVIEGMDVVDDIGHRATTRSGDLQEMPAQPVVIEHMTLLSSGTK
jgi:cyclophilin family peptidyl-prolyl cis-trans isomerase